MKQLNGELIIRFSIMAYLECSQAEADTILASTEREAKERLRDLIHSKNPVNENIFEHQLQDFRTDVGRSLVAARERQLKQIPERTEASV